MAGVSKKKSVRGAPSASDPLDRRPEGGRVRRPGASAGSPRSRSSGAGTCARARASGARVSAPKRLSAPTRATPGRRSWPPGAGATWIGRYALSTMNSPTCAGGTCRGPGGRGSATLPSEPVAVRLEQQHVLAGPGPLARMASWRWARLPSSVRVRAVASTTRRRRTGRRRDARPRSRRTPLASRYSRRFRGGPSRPAPARRRARRAANRGA